MKEKFWTMEEILVDIDNDKMKMGKVPSKIKENLSDVIKFFAVSDNLVSSYLDNMKLRIKNLEFREAIAVQTYMEESVHSPTYLEMLKLFMTPNEILEFAIDIGDFPGLKRKIAFIQKYLPNDIKNFMKISLEKQLAVCCLIEGVFFCTAFVTILWCREKGHFICISTANEMVAKDEWEHNRLFGKAYAIERKDAISKGEIVMTRDELIEILEEIVGIEIEFIDKSLKHESIDLSKNNLHDFARYMGDYSLNLMGESKYYDIGIPSNLSFMMKIMTRVNTNFFEGTNAGYMSGTIIDINKLRFD